jgi:CPA1 family monovalent cation:H+ antiporter
MKRAGLIKKMAANIELIIAAFLLVTFIAAVLSIRSKRPYTLVLVLVGVGITAGATLLSLVGGPIHELAQSIIEQIRSFDNLLIEGGGTGLFVGIVVPPLVFESMMHIRGGDLRAVIKPSLVLATGGVMIATLIGGLVLWQLAGLPFYVAFLFAALIAPTDVVTILEVFRRVKVPPKLTILLNTEAAFNDATAIVVFTIILSSATLHQAGFLDAVLGFSFTLIMGLLIGLAVGFVAEILSSLIEDRVAECILTVSTVYGAFALATGIGASGIIAVAVVGLYFGNFTIRAAMESATRNTIMNFWEVVAFLANSVAFLFIGFQTDLINLGESIVLIAVAFLAVTLARAASVYPIFGFFRRRGEKIPAFWSHIAMLGGVRGALSIVLATTITVSAVVSQSDIQTVSTMALGVAFISITIQVPLLFSYVKRKLKNQEETDAEQIEEKLANVCSSVEETRMLMSDGQLTNEEFVRRLEENKEELDKTIHESATLLETRKIIRRRATLLYKSVAKERMDKDQKGKKKTSKTRARKKDKTEQQKNAKQQE